MARRVLIVADEPEVLAVCRTLCDPVRFHVVFARTIDDARASLGLTPSPDLVIVDADLTNGGGVGFCREIKGRWPPLRVLLIMRGKEAQLGSADWAGADAVVSRVDPETVAAVLDQLLGPSPRAGAA